MQNITVSSLYTSSSTSNGFLLFFCISFLNAMNCSKQINNNGVFSNRKIHSLIFWHSATTPVCFAALISQ